MVYPCDVNFVPLGVVRCVRTEQSGPFTGLEHMQETGTAHRMCSDIEISVWRCTAFGAPWGPYVEEPRGVWTDWAVMIGGSEDSLKSLAEIRSVSLRSRTSGTCEREAMTRVLHRDGVQKDRTGPAVLAGWAV